MENDQFEQRKEKLNELRSLGFNPFANGYRPDSLAGELSSRFASIAAEELENREDTFSLAGRVVGLRDFGKSTFFHIADRSGKIQAYIKKDVIGDEGLKFFKKYVDLGDFVGISGNLFKTRTGELTVNVKVVFPFLPSLLLTSLMLMLGRGGGNGAGGGAISTSFTMNVSVVAWPLWLTDVLVRGYVPGPGSKSAVPLKTPLE